MLSNGTLEINIVEINIIDGGIEVFASATLNGLAVGFSKDGTVEIERFKIFNPPVLIPDGTKREIAIDDEKDIIEVDNFTEDAEEALRQTLIENIKMVGKSSEDVIVGKIGNTTSTFYPDSSPETTSVDGFAGYEGGTTDWDTAHDATTGTSVNDSATTINCGAQKQADATFRMYRAFHLFDTSAIPETDTIDSATISLWGTTVTNGDNDGDDFISIVSTTPASNTALVAGDYDQCGAVDDPTEMVDVGQRKYLSSISTDVYTVWTLNATGEANISKTGVSKFGAREGHDILDNPYAGANNTKNRMIHSSSEVTGTTQDPKLVVEHTAGSATSIKEVNGLAIASVKSRNGLAIASVKSINGLSNV